MKELQKIFLRLCLDPRIGVEVLQKGGNAVDAAVTTAFVSGVLLPILNGIGGGGLIDGRTYGW